MTQKLICNNLGVDDGYHSVLNSHKQWGIPHHAVKNEHNHLLHDGSGH